MSLVLGYPTQRYGPTDAAEAASAAVTTARKMTNLNASSNDGNMKSIKQTHITSSSFQSSPRKTNGPLTRSSSEYDGSNERQASGNLSRTPSNSSSDDWDATYTYSEPGTLLITDDWNEAPNNERSPVRSARVSRTSSNASITSDVDSSFRPEFVEGTVRITNDWIIEEDQFDDRVNGQEEENGFENETTQPGGDDDLDNEDDTERDDTFETLPPGDSWADTGFSLPIDPQKQFPLEDWDTEMAQHKQSTSFAVPSLPSSQHTKTDPNLISDDNANHAQTSSRPQKTNESPRPLVQPVPPSLPPIKLHSKWVFWYDRRMTDPTYRDQAFLVYEGNLAQFAVVDSIESFWGVYNNLVPASQILVGGNLHVFKFGIKPMWEDPLNASGGDWSITISRNQDLVWLRTLIAMMSNFLDNNQVCGAEFKKRGHGDKILVWNRTSRDGPEKNELGLKLADPSLLGTSTRYEKHSSALQGAFNRR